MARMFSFNSFKFLRYYMPDVIFFQPASQIAPFLLLIWRLLRFEHFQMRFEIQKSALFFGTSIIKSLTFYKFSSFSFIRSLKQNTLFVVSYFSLFILFSYFIFSSIIQANVYENANAFSENSLVLALAFFACCILLFLSNSDALHFTRSLSDSHNPYFSFNFLKFLTNTQLSPLLSLCLNIAYIQVRIQLKDLIQILEVLSSICFLTSLRISMQQFTLTMHIFHQLQISFLSDQMCFHSLSIHWERRGTIFLALIIGCLSKHGLHALQVR